MKRKTCMLQAFAGGLLTFGLCVSTAQAAWPEKPIRFIVPSANEMSKSMTAEIRKALATPVLIERYKALDTEIDGGTSEEFLALVRRETPKWAAVIKRANVKVD